jgi:hypothetical protein
MGNLFKFAFAMSLGVLALSSNYSIADDVGTSTQVATDIVVEEDTYPGSRSKNESWYMYWGLGWSKPSYGNTQVATELDSLKNRPQTSNIGLNLDLLGFYFPINRHQTALGLIVNAIADRYNISGSGSIQINQYLFSFSTMHFLTSNIGNGFFLRGDVGISKFSAVRERFGNSVTDTSDVGFGALAGLGYAIPLTPGNRLLLGANYAYRTATTDGETFDASTFSLTTGLMF